MFLFLESLMILCAILNSRLLPTGKQLLCKARQSRKFHVIPHIIFLPRILYIISIPIKTQKQFCTCTLKDLKETLLIIFSNYSSLQHHPSCRSTTLRLASLRKLNLRLIDLLRGSKWSKYKFLLSGWISFIDYWHFFLASSTLNILPKIDLQICSQNLGVGAEALKHNFGRVISPSQQTSDPKSAWGN